MAATLICVLRSGGEYRAEHVQALARQVPGLVCLSDQPIDGVPIIPMLHDWPGWWCKMELFRPDIYGDLFYLDLDTVVLGDIGAMASVGQTVMLDDFYWPGQAASGVMYLTEQDRATVWQEWVKCPEQHMTACGRLGDQKFIGDCLPHARRWQHLFPRQVISYKVHVCTRQQAPRGIGTGLLPADANVVCFHGQPRPWGVRHDWVPRYD